MSQTDPSSTTVQDICQKALEDLGVVGMGQTANTVDLNKAWVRLQYLLTDWTNKRWLSYQLQTAIAVSTGSGTASYTVGDGGQFDTNPASANALSFLRPDKIEAAWVRRPGGTPAQNVDFPLRLIQSGEDWARLTMKSLPGFPQYVYYEPSWPLGKAYFFPSGDTTYTYGLLFKAPLPTNFATLGTALALPYQYLGPLSANLSIDLAPSYGISILPGNPLSTIARRGLASLRGSNIAVSRLNMPSELLGGSGYNIFSDNN